MSLNDVLLDLLFHLPLRFGEQPLYGVQRSLVLLRGIYEKLESRRQVYVDVGESTDYNNDLQEALERAFIVQKKSVSRIKDSDDEESEDLLDLHPPGSLVPHAVYARGTRFHLLEDIPLIDAIVNAMSHSVVHSRRKAPCVLLIRGGMTLAPSRFRVRTTELDTVMSLMKRISRLTRGTTGDKGANSDPDTSVKTAGIRLHNNFIMCGPATCLTTAEKTFVQETLAKCDAFYSYLMRLLVDCLVRWEDFGFAPNKGVDDLVDSLSAAFREDRRRELELAKYVLGVFYETRNRLNAHVDETLYATFITTRTPNPDNVDLLYLADVDGDELRYSIPYGQWDVVFFQRGLLHAAVPSPHPRDILNFFY